MSSSEWGPHHGVSGFARKESGSDLFLRYVRMQEDSHLQARERAFREQIKGILISDFPDVRTVKKIGFPFFFFFSAIQTVVLCFSSLGRLRQMVTGKLSRPKSWQS